MNRRAFFGKFLMAAAAVAATDVLKLFKITKFKKGDIIPEWVMHTEDHNRQFLRFGTNVIAYKTPDETVVRALNMKNGEPLVKFTGNGPALLQGKPTTWIGNFTWFV